MTVLEPADRAMDARLLHDDAAPVAVALSGGGDSVALLAIATQWARRRGRRLIALTVDHGLHPDARAWSGFARETAARLGADWRGLEWTGRKPANGRAAAARRARHALLADAAREAGARVILFGHTGDDALEAARMRAEGSTVGRLRDWSPSPAWPQGRGLMLLRPLLSARREAVRAWLTDLGLSWIDDPFNADPGSLRARARAALAGTAAEPPRAENAPRPRGWTGAGADGLILDRDADGRTLGAAVVCAGGGDRPPDGDRLAALQDRVRGGGPFVATLCGARVVGEARGVRITREAGEMTRAGRPAMPLAPGREVVWDGRFAVRTDQAGWSVTAAAGHRSRLSARDLAWLKALPADARGARPVLIRDTGGGAVLAEPAGEARSLVEHRLASALDRTPHERDLRDRADGATARQRLSVGAESTNPTAACAVQGSRRE